MPRERPANLGEAIRQRLNKGPGQRINYIDRAGNVHTLPLRYGEKGVSILGWKRITELQRSLAKQGNFKQRQKLARIK